MAALILVLFLSMSVVEARGSALSLKNFEIFEDTEGSLSFADISSQSFEPYREDTIFLGISKSAFWLRFVLPPGTYEELDHRYLLEFDNPSISKIDLYLPVREKEGGVSYVMKSGGQQRGFQNKEIWSPDTVVSVPRNYAEGQYVYLRLESVSALRLPILLWQEKDFSQDFFIKNIGYGIFYGILIGMFFYNLFISFVLRDKTYLYYVLYIFFMLIYQMDTHGYMNVFLNLDYSSYMASFWVCLAAAFVFSCLFTASFLQVHEDELHLSVVFKVLILTAMLQGLLGAFGHSIWANKLAYFLGIAEPIFFISLAIYRVVQGFHPARYYLLAWGILSIGIVAWIILPDRTMALHIFMLSSDAEVILLSLALSDRFKMMRLKELALTRNVDYYRDLSLTDELTGLYNRRYLKRKSRQKMLEASSEGKGLALLVIDIDFFKKFNDAYGHWQGDQVLIRFSEVLLNVLADEQLAFRFGGEEFVVLLPDAARGDALAVAERIRCDFAAEVFSPAAGKKIHVTLSIGAAALRAKDTEASFFQRADTGLYQAKAAGRNTVVFL